jgi:hypothetical protein
MSMTLHGTSRLRKRTSMDIAGIRSLYTGMRKKGPGFDTLKMLRNG